MENPDVAAHSLRLNLRNEKHLRVENALKQVDPKIFKSLNEFMIDAIDFYIKYLDGEDISIKIADKNNNMGNGQWVTKEDLSEMKLVIKEELKAEVIQLLGMALSGHLAQDSPIMTEETVEEGGITDTAALDLVASWG